MGKHKNGEHGGEGIRYPKDDCNHCGKKSPMTPENTRFDLYEGYPLANHFFTVCVHCEEATRIFTESERKDVEAMGYPVYDQLRVPTALVLWSTLRAHGIDDLEPVELTEDQERQVRNIGDFLQTIIVTVQDFE